MPKTGTDVDSSSSKQLSANDIMDKYAFQSDEVIASHSDQGTVYAQAQSMVKSFLKNATNCTVLAYGSAHSGKTDTIIGRGFEQYLELD